MDVTAVSASDENCHAWSLGMKGRVDCVPEWVELKYDEPDLLVY
jgi:hypothetical protein